MNLNLTGKVAVVTGASKGIGAEIAKALAEEGVSVIINYDSDSISAEKVVDSIKWYGGNAVAVKANVASSSEVQEMFAVANKTFGKVDIVVNNAGVFKFAPVEEVTEEEFHREFNINVLGPILTTQAALKYFPPTGGSIINIGSIGSQFPTANSCVYSATKGALDTLSKVLAIELASRKIRVNTVAPGATETEGLLAMGAKGVEIKAQLIAATPLGRMGQTTDIASVVTFLASDAAGWITGERIKVTGGA